MGCKIKMALMYMLDLVTTESPDSGPRFILYAEEQVASSSSEESVRQDEEEQISL